MNIMEQAKLNWEQLKKEAVARLRQTRELSGKNGALTPIIKMIVEAALEEELNEYLQKERSNNRKNGKAPKTVKSIYGKLDLAPSRDRNGTFESDLIGKRQVTLGNALDNKIIKLCAKGVSYTDIRDYIDELYGISVSEAQISSITNSIIPNIKEWQNRPLEPVYVVLWLDAIHFKVREEGRIVSKAVYCIMGLNQHGRKELLGMYLGKSESASFWLKILTELKNRGLKDVLIACIDNLKGFKEAISTTLHKTEIQQCVIHQIRNSMKYISHKDSKEFLTDLKSVYQTNTEDLAENNLLLLSEKWIKKYPHVVQSWQNNWPELCAYFKYPKEIRRIIYTTNTIESFHSQIRKVTKTKRVFSSDMALMKLLYLIQENVTSKWTMPMHNWGQILSQFTIIFPNRLELDLQL